MSCIYAFLQLQATSLEHLATRQILMALILILLLFFPSVAYSFHIDPSSTTATPAPTTLSRDNSRPTLTYYYSTSLTPLPTRTTYSSTAPSGQHPMLSTASLNVASTCLHMTAVSVSTARPCTSYPNVCYTAQPPSSPTSALSATPTDIILLN